ncbi:MAG: GNAT family N-acetyltransferase [Paracoccaceae bacterium]|nr:GNAT family N-acetyltransferase [Paracoccaceae bacterium]
MKLLRATGDYDWAAVLRLIRDAFAYMEGRIDPPSSMHSLSAKDIAESARNGEVWVMEEAGAPIACMVLTPMPGRLYLGRLAVATGHRGRGLSRQLVETAEARAAALGFDVLELQSRIELVENHAIFAAMGFKNTAETRHAGYDRATSLTFQKRVGSAASEPQQSGQL